MHVQWHVTALLRGWRRPEPMLMAALSHSQVVVLDGVPYHQNEHGVRVLAGSEPSPFMTVTWFGARPRLSAR